MHVLALIPARGGSKGIPRKNVVDLAGRPLIAYTIEAALNARLVDRVVVSTDDREIAATARAFGAEVPFDRPAALSTDEVPAFEVIAHAVGALEAIDDRRVDYLVYLQPTSPLRTADHIDRGVQAIQKSGADVLVSVIEVPHRFSPQSMLVMEQGRLRPLHGGPAPLRRQDKQKLYARNGPAVLILNRSRVGEPDLYSGTTLGMEMDEAASVDIDSPDDLDMAEYFLRKRRGEGRRR